MKLDPLKEKDRIASFIKSVLAKQNFKNIVIGMSGGIDSTTSFYLLKEALPAQNIFVAHLHYFNSYFQDIEPILKEAKRQGMATMRSDGMVKVLDGVTTIEEVLRETEA